MELLHTLYRNLYTYIFPNYAIVSVFVQATEVQTRNVLKVLCLL
jgi:hypothetical protein